MRLLLDTHVAIWAVESSRLIPAHILDVIADPANEPFVSLASVWEIAIKKSKPWAGEMPFTSAEALHRFDEAGFQSLPIEPKHILQVELLPPIHRDPFDRLLVAQALSEPMRLISADKQLAAYSDTVITW